MTGQEQIEEMAKEIEKAKQHIWASVMAQAEYEDYLWHSRAIAEHLTSQGYQKIDMFAECRNCTAWSGTDCTRNPYTQGCLKDENNIKRQAVKEFAEKLKDYITDLAVEEFGDCACDMQYLTINIDDFADKIDELLKEYEK